MIYSTTENTQKMKMLNFLLQNGGNVNLQNANGFSPIFFSRCADVFIYLCKAGASLHVVNNALENAPLYLYCSVLTWKTVYEEYISKGGNPTLENCHGISFIHKTVGRSKPIPECPKDHFDALQYLLDNGVRISFDSMHEEESNRCIMSLLVDTGYRTRRLAAFHRQCQTISMKDKLSMLRLLLKDNGLKVDVKTKPFKREITLEYKPLITRTDTLLEGLRRSDFYLLSRLSAPNCIMLYEAGFVIPFVEVLRDKLERGVLDNALQYWRHSYGRRQIPGRFLGMLPVLPTVEHFMMLKKQCRETIRQSLGVATEGKVNFLPLPQILKDYLRLPELDHILIGDVDEQQ